MSENIHEEIRFLEICISELEEKLHWGKKEEWTNYHFTKLSDSIAEITGVRISVSSIRRILGMDKSYKEKFNPHIETKNTLAKYLGYENWAVFKTKNQKRTNVSSKKQIISRKHLVLISVIAGVIILIPGVIKLYNIMFPETIYFVAKNTVGFAPHTVTFQYDITHLRRNNIFIDFNEQFNSTGRITRLPKDEHIITHTFFNSYFYPVKVIYKDKIIVVEPVLIKSDGWEGGVIIDNKEYVNIPQQYLTNDNMLCVTPQELKLNGIDTTKPYETEYKLINDFVQRIDSITLQSDIISFPSKGGSKCNKIQIGLLGDNALCYITFTNTGCSSMAHIIFSEVVKNGQHEDLKDLSFNLIEWNTLKIEIKDMSAKILLGNNTIYKLNYNNPMGKLRGIHYKFSGSGAADNIRIIHQDPAQCMNFHFSL